MSAYQSERSQRAGQVAEPNKRAEKAVEYSDSDTNRRKSH